MLSLSSFATEQYPLHCSSIPYLMDVCAWNVAMKHVEQPDRTSGSAADTGSAMHHAACVWHRTKRKEVKRAIDEMRAATEDYPMANLVEADKLFRAYTEDERNHVELTHVEWKIDPPIQIERSIWLTGTIDQIREDEEGLSVWDIKTGARSGRELRESHRWQIAAYSVLASIRLRRTVRPGGIIAARGYLKGTEVMWPYEMTHADAESLMLSVVEQVEKVRRGEMSPANCWLCRFCVGMDNCVPKLEQTLRREGKCETL